MNKSLVLAEKPSVGRELAKILGCKQNGSGFITGPKHIVTWALGHLVTLADPELYDKKYKTWSLDTLPMLPKNMRLVVIRETSKQFKIVQSLMNRNDVSEIIIATDSGREGELVARWIMIKAGCSKPAKRLWISSQTEKAIKEGFANLKPASNYYNLFLSAQSRSEADWLVGLNVTRALTCKYNAQLSAGRVQTPTLSMIVDRESEIKQFTPTEYYVIKADFKGFSATRIDQNNQTRIFNKAEAENLVKKLNKNSGLVASITKKKKQKAPPAAYDLTELQRDANKKYAYSAKETLSIMQSLYERHKLLTYPRTDSRYVTDDIVPTLPDRLKAISVGPYKEMAAALLRAPAISSKHIVNNKLVTDHHAIIPTEESVRLYSLSKEELNIYDLVVKRFLAVLSSPYEYEETNVTITIDKERFASKGEIVKNLGWKKIYSSSDPGDDNSNDDDLLKQTLPALNKDDILKINKLYLETGKTKPPARYTEASLLTAMENPPTKNMSSELKNALKESSGLGTPATRADIIEKLFSSFYIERQGKSIIPTSKGIQLIDLAPEALKSAELTAKWEQELSLISKGQVKSQDFIKKMREYASQLVSNVIASDKKYVHDNMTREKCPDCGKYLLEVKGKRGLMLICSDRDCGYRKSLSIQTNSRCPNCHKKMEIRGEGDKRLFACVCGFRERVSDFEKKRKTAGASKHDVKKYLESQKKDSSGGSSNSALADQLAKWKEINWDE